MRAAADLEQTLTRIDGRGYKAYKDIGGTYRFQGYTLFVDYVQGDPFASPSRLRTRVPQAVARVPADLYANRARRIALQDYLTRMCAAGIRRLAKGHRGTGKSGMIAVDTPGQTVLERTSMVVNGDFVEARFSVGLPAAGRRVLGREAAQMLCRELPRIVETALSYENLDDDQVRAHVNLAEDQEHIRAYLRMQGLIAFVANDALLPRRSGISDLPMAREQAVTFVSPPDMEVELHPPHHGPLRGMGIRQGVTLICGGGYHGKSTLLRALERGVYNHIGGDGREWVITDPDAVKIRAEDGRRVEKVNISPFINNLPFGQDTIAFSSEEASGSTSQAANIMEAVEAGARVLLIDEDTSATNFMIRDVRMQALVAKEKEPITPFVDKVGQLWTDQGVSTILVVGGSGDYFEAADTVLVLDEYRPRNDTPRAREIAADFPSGRRPEGGESFGDIRPRVPLAARIDPTKGPRGKVSIKAQGTDTIRFGLHDIDLQQVEQIVDRSQTAAIGDLLYYLARRYMDGQTPIEQVVAQALADVDQVGLDVLSPFQGQHPGDYARPRSHEVAAALNRLRTLQVEA